MVVVEGRHLCCWSCKQLGHISKFCLKKDLPNAAAAIAALVTTTTTVTTATISSESEAKERESGPAMVVAIIPLLYYIIIWYYSNGHVMVIHDRLNFLLVHLQYGHQ